MPTIGPPPQFSIIDAKPDERPSPIANSFEQARRFALYLNVKPWVCPVCGGKMFGRCIECVYCRILHNKHTPRPAHYTKEGGA